MRVNARQAWPCALSSSRPHKISVVLDWFVENDIAEFVSEYDWSRSASKTASLTASVSMNSFRPYFRVHLKFLWRTVQCCNISLAWRSWQNNPAALRRDVSPSFHTVQAAVVSIVCSCPKLSFGEHIRLSAPLSLFFPFSGFCGTHAKTRRVLVLVKKWCKMPLEEDLFEATKYS